MWLNRGSSGRTALALPPGGAGTLGDSSYAAAVCAAAALVGIGYALGAYRLDPGLPPLVAAGAVALGLGLWRLEYGLALLIIVTPFAENVPITQVGDAKIRVALIAVPVAGDEAAAASKFMLLAGSVSIYLLIGMFVDDMRKLWTVIVALVVVGLIVAIHAIYQYAVGDLSRVGFLNASGTVEYRVASFFPHPNQLAGFLVMLVPLALGVMAATRSRVLQIAALLLAVLSIVGVVLTYSRGGLVALIALPLILIRDKRSWPLIVAGIVLITLLAPSVWRDRVAEVAKTDQPAIATRLDFWAASLDMFQAHPVAGVGLDSFSDAYQALERPGRSYLGGGVLVAPETAHNLYLNTLAEQGLI